MSDDLTTEWMAGYHHRDAEIARLREIVAGFIDNHRIYIAANCCCEWCERGRKEIK